MGKLNIAHHKSYHPYRLDNIERVRKDEEAARLKEQGEEGRMRMADSEARLDLLRGRAGDAKRLKQKDSKGEGEESQQLPVPALTTISTTAGHINLFADFEQHATSTALLRSREVAAKGVKAEDEKGFRLAPSARDLKPWYVDKDANNEEMSMDKRLKDLSSKMTVDPLTSIKSELSRSYPSPGTQSSSFTSSRRERMPSNTTEARVQRESSERARAMELIRRRKREKEREALGMANMTPSSVGGDDLDRNAGYGDVYNRQETEDAHRRRERGWGRDRERERGRGSFQDRQRDRGGAGSRARSIDSRDRRW
ncbi:hypothetical protein JB92DRAFT_2817852 [Gautieria morchelliformis]|nr:hypothetical protein JB92DRAFT_2817852 [Gautieria morchelliformis]